MAKFLIALGANVPGPWGGPVQTLREAIRRLARSGIAVTAASRIYTTAPVGGLCQPWFRNAVVVADCPLPPARALALFKRIERAAGRRPSRGRGARPLDIDIVDAGGRITGHRITGHRMAKPSRSREAGRLILPHPEAHRRRFVIEPLLEVAPHWFHTPTGASGRRLAARLPGRRGQVRPTLDSLLVP